MAEHSLSKAAVDTHANQRNPNNDTCRHALGIFL